MRRGPLYMSMAAAVFTLMVIALKLARESMGALDVTAWRSLTAIPFAFAIGHRQLRNVKRKGLLLVRCALGFMGVLAFVTAAKGLSVAELSLLHKLQPIWVAVLAPVFLGSQERAGGRVWLAMAMGLGGSALILAPGLQGSDHLLLRSGMWAAGGALFSALAHVSLRALGRTEDARTVVFWFQASLLPFSLLALSFAPSAPLPDFHWPLIAALGSIGITAVLGQLLMTQAYKLDRASLTAAASYTGPLWAYLVDYAVFGVIPTPLGLVGGAMVVSAGLYLVFAGDTPADSSRLAHDGGASLPTDFETEPESTEELNRCRC